MTILNRDSQQLDDKERYRRLDARLTSLREQSGVEVKKEIDGGPGDQTDQTVAAMDICEEAVGAVADTGKGDSDEESVIFVDENILDHCVVKDARLGMLVLAPAGCELS